VHNFEEMRHQHPPPKSSFSFLSCSGDSDPNVYLEWEAKVDQIFNVYEVKEDQKVKLAFPRIRKICHAVVASSCISWYDIKKCMRAVCSSSL